MEVIANETAIDCNSTWSVNITSLNKILNTFRSNMGEIVILGWSDFFHLSYTMIYLIYIGLVWSKKVICAFSPSELIYLRGESYWYWRHETSGMISQLKSAFLIIGSCRNLVQTDCLIFYLFIKHPKGLSHEIELCHDFFNITCQII